LLGPAALLQLLDTAFNGKRITRLTVEHDRVLAIQSTARDVGLICLRAPVDYRRSHSDDGLQRLHGGGFVPSGSEGQTQAVLYFAREIDDLARAVHADLAEDHETIGALFGYPACCVGRFARGQGAGTAAQDQTAASMSGLGPFEGLMNPALRLFRSIRTHFHFPCALSCAETLAAARARMKALAEISPTLRRAADLGSGLLIYSPTGGAVWGDAEFGPGRRSLIVRESMLPAPLELPAGAVLTIDLRDHRQFRVGGVSFSNPDRRCCFFKA